MVNKLEPTGNRKEKKNTVEPRLLLEVPGKIFPRRYEDEVNSDE